MRSLVTSIFLYACESWTLTAELQRRIQDMEMRCYRKILRISYKDHDTNEEVHGKIQQAIGPHEDPLTIVKSDCYSAPKLTKYTAALGAYNVKSFTCEINQHMHEHTHTHTHHTRTHTQAGSKKFVLRIMRQRNKSRRLETLLKEMGFQSLSK